MVCRTAAGQGKLGIGVEGRKRRCYARLVATLVRQKVGLILCAASLVGHAAPAAGTDSHRTGDQTSGHLDVGGSKIYYETRGAGQAIVLLHDGLLSSVIWDGIWESLAVTNRVIRYDRRGYGRSELPTSSYSSIEDLRKLLTHLKVHRAVVVGSSAGGALAIDFAIENPQMVDGLFLIGPVLHGLSYTAYFQERAARNNEPAQRDDIVAVARNWSEDRFLIAGPNERARRNIYEWLVANAEKLKFNDHFEQSLSPPASKRLTEVKASTRILVGETDIADVHAHCGAINAGIRGSTLEVVKDSGHLIQLERPEEVGKKIEAFAEQCEANRH